MGPKPHDDGSLGRSSNPVGRNAIEARANVDPPEKLKAAGREQPTQAPVLIHRGSGHGKPEG